jgi:regulator of sirC expression with transglutaminase-like and TPR domain
MTNHLSPRQRFAEMVKAGEEKLDLAEAALVISQEEYPLLQTLPYTVRLDALANHVKGAIGVRHEPLVGIGAMNRELFEEEGYVGNKDDYYDPRNSFLNEVMDRKIGIPITLSLLYMEVARRAGLPVAGIGLPGHFIVRYLAPDRSYWIDPFHQGAFLSEEDCRERVQRIYGGRMPFRQDYLKPMTSFSILSRLLYNLKNIYVESKSHAKALAVIEKLVLLNPAKWEEVRDRGLVLYQLKNYKAALQDLEVYLQNAPQAQDREDLLKLAQIIKDKGARS